ncbi:MAG: hypothetical protein SF028_06635 [Candidatus Sumerlaeia bacterium]|nr:hypothetical protein [Candidatus Sumerlaeia bacterium]
MAPHNEDLMEQELPAGWDPAADADERWLAIADSLREADPAPRLLPAQSDALRAEIRSRLEAESLLRPADAARAGGFADWLRTLFLGGGVAAQTVRLGVAAAIAVMVVAPDTPQPGLAPANRPRPVDVVVQRDLPAGNAIGEVASAPEAAAQAPPPATEGRAMDEVVASAPGTRSEVAMRAFPAADADAKLAGQFAMDSGFPSLDGALLGRALQQVQGIKLASVAKDDLRIGAQLRNLEALIVALAGAASDPGIQLEVAALAEYARGEQALEALRPDEALAAFDAARAASPDGLVGFLALYQTARVQFEYRNDFEAAEATYRRCLDEFPEQLLPPDVQSEVADRLRLLAQSAPLGHRDLRIWQAATRTASPVARADRLRELLASYPDSALAAPAAEELGALLVADAGLQRLNLDDSMALLESTVASREDGPETARIQFTLAELVYRRAMNPRRATAEYREVLRMGADRELRSRAEERLASVAVDRLTWPTAMEN